MPFSLRAKLVMGLAAIGTLAAALPVRAHEVYVLTPDELHQALASPQVNPLSEIVSHESQFLVWAFLSFFVLALVFLLSILRPLEKRFDPWLFKIKRLAPTIARVTLGGSLAASGYYQALFGPELALSTLAGPVAPALGIILMVLGALIVLGLFARLAAVAALALFGFAALRHGLYLLTYFNYLGLMLIILGIGSHSHALDALLPKFRRPRWLVGLELFFHKYAFLILRVFFGVSLMFASFYAKFLNANLALETVAKYDLTRFFPFDPLFLVLGAMIIEMLIGLFFIIGFELRFTALVYIIFLTLSISFFGETVWPHLILYGTALAIFVAGYDRYTIEGRFLKTRSREPVL